MHTYWIEPSESFHSSWIHHTTERDVVNIAHMLSHNVTDKNFHLIYHIIIIKQSVCCDKTVTPPHSMTKLALSEPVMKIFYHCLSFYGRKKRDLFRLKINKIKLILDTLIKYKTVFTVM